MSTITEKVILFLAGFILFGMIFVLAFPAEACDAFPKPPGADLCPPGYFTTDDGKYCIKR